MKKWATPWVAAAVLAGTLIASPALAARVYIKIAPPAPIAEVRVVAPGPGHVWIPGFHRWDGRAYIWVPGRWDLPPRPGVVWVTGHWRHHRHGWYWVEGRWR
jgi:YXWGXW repeat-containing protein